MARSNFELQGGDLGVQRSHWAVAAHAVAPSVAFSRPASSLVLLHRGGAVSRGRSDSYLRTLVLALGGISSQRPMREGVDTPLIGKQAEIEVAAHPRIERERERAEGSPHGGSEFISEGR